MAWLSTITARSPLGDRHRAEGIWLYEPGGGIFEGYYVEFGLDEPVESHEYGDSKGPRQPSHFWDGDEKPAYPPRI